MKEYTIHDLMNDEINNKADHLSIADAPVQLKKDRGQYLFKNNKTNGYDYSNVDPQYWPAWFREEYKLKRTK